MAAGDILQVYGTPIVWQETAGDKAFTLKGMAPDGIRCGPWLDRGDLAATPGADEYIWELVFDGFSGAIAIDEILTLYFAESSDGINFDGAIDTTGLSETTEATNSPTSGMLSNMNRAGFVKAISTVVADKLIIRGNVRLRGRYSAPVVHNETIGTTANTDDIHSIKLIPIWDRVM